MNNVILIYAGSVMIFGWGIAHLFPTRSVVRDFGEISADNKRIITMEWIIEGVALVFTGILSAVVTYIDGTSAISKAVYAIVIIMLNVLSVVSLFTGFRNSFFAFKLCPFIFTGSSILIGVGILI